MQAGVTIAGSAESFLKASHITRTRRAHQITASSLYILLQMAYTVYARNTEDALSLDDWALE